MEQVRTKEKYQVHQIRQSSENAVADCPHKHQFTYGENRMSSIKEVLQSNSKDIQQLVKQVNNAKRDLVA